MSLELIMIKNIPFLIVFYLLTSISSAFADASIVQNNIQFFTNLCDKNKAEKKPVKNSTLLLIDATDPVITSNAQNLRDNFIKSFDWKEEGDRVSIVILSDKPVATSDFATMCAPVPNDKITATMAKLVQQKQIRAFKEGLSYSFESLVNTNKSSAKNTSLIELIVEVFRSKRFGFDDVSSKRHLIIASDLYQNTDQISFYKLCKGNTCPTFASSMQNKEINTFMTRFAKLQTTSNDSVEIYQFQPRSKMNFSISDWWTEYFHFAGIDSLNIHH
jgi:hypothetical protein